MNVDASNVFAGGHRHFGSRVQCRRIGKERRSLDLRGSGIGRCARSGQAGHHRNVVLAGRKRIKSISAEIVSSLAIHAVVNYVETTGMDNMREREIEREIQRELRRRGLTESDLLQKPKRDAAVRLSDDGELVYEDDEESVEPLRPSKRRGR